MLTLDKSIKWIIEKGVKIWQKKSEEILTLLDELILQQHLKAMAWEEGRGDKVPSAAVWHQP